MCDMCKCELKENEEYNIWFNDANGERANAQICSKWCMIQFFNIRKELESVQD